MKDKKEGKVRDMEFDKTMHFEVEKIENLRTKEILKEVYEALQKKRI